MSSGRYVTSAPLLLLGLLAITATAGCAKRYEGSLKDETRPARVMKASAQQKWRRVSAVTTLPEAPAPSPQPPVMPPPAAAPPPSAAPQDAGSPCASSERCGAVLRGLLNDPSRSWVGKRQTIDDHMTGTRQFAYLALVKVMRCQELLAGVKDVTAAAALSPPAGKYPAAVLAQIKDLDAHVIGVLKSETNARCR